MFQIRKKIIDYYSNLINEIDIKAETLLLNKNLNQNQIDEINLLRKRFIDQVNKIQELNLSKAEQNAKEALKNKKDNDDIRSFLFRDKFCLFLENKKEYKYCFEDAYSIGKLIILSNFLSLEPAPPSKKYFKIILIFSIHFFNKI